MFVMPITRDFVKIMKTTQNIYFLIKETCWLSSCIGTMWGAKTPLVPLHGTDVLNSTKYSVHGNLHFLFSTVESTAWVLEGFSTYYHESFNIETKEVVF